MSDTYLKPVFALPSNFTSGEVPGLTVPSGPVPVPSLGPLAAFTGTFRGRASTRSSGPTTRRRHAIAEADSPARHRQRARIVPYLQVISDVTVPGQPVGTHFEPGLWMAVPATTDPPRRADAHADGVDPPTARRSRPGDLVDDRGKAHHTGGGYHPVLDCPTAQRTTRSSSPVRRRPTRTPRGYRRTWPPSSPPARSPRRC